MALLRVNDLKVHYKVRSTFLSSDSATVRAVDGVGFSIDQGETVGLVGESGCGKTTVGRAILGLITPTEGSIHFKEQLINRMDSKSSVRRDLQMIFQDPYSSINPRLTVAQVISEGLEIHGIGSRQEQKEKVFELLESVKLSPEHAARYPHEFSGGQRQRIVIARALALQPKLIVCDEPVSALDVSVQAQVVTLLKELQKRRGLAYLFIAHDLAVVQHMSNRILVMYLGKVVEAAEADRLISQPKHPYTEALISAIPTLEKKGPERIRLAGDIPSPLAPPSGCPFHTRCRYAREICRSEVPALREIVPGQVAACHFSEEIFGK